MTSEERMDRIELLLEALAERQSSDSRILAVHRDIHAERISRLEKNLDRMGERLQVILDVAERQGKNVDDLIAIANKNADSIAFLKQDSDVLHSDVGSLRQDIQDLIRALLRDHKNGSTPHSTG